MQIRALSRLPSREVLYGQLVGVVASPVSGLVRTLGALVGGLAVALGQVQEKKHSGEIPAGEAPAAPPGPAAAEEAPAQDPAPEDPLPRTLPPRSLRPRSPQPKSQQPRSPRRARDTRGTS